jgi:hypothetical protein
MRPRRPSRNSCSNRLRLEDPEATILSGHSTPCSTGFDQSSQVRSAPEQPLALVAARQHVVAVTAVERDERAAALDDDPVVAVVAAELTTIRSAPLVPRITSSPLVPRTSAAPASAGGASVSATGATGAVSSVPDKA